VAIVIFAVATLLAAAITYSKAMTARRAAATYTMEQALQAGMAAEALASMALEKDGRSADRNHQEWAQVQQPWSWKDTGVWIAAQVEDMAAAST
jgi:type II secretory pathway component PulK